MSDVESEPEIKEEGPSIGTYEGDRNDAKQRHGKGKNTFPNGDVYEGSYANGHREGPGTYRWKNGARYAGDYKDDLREGSGLFVYPDGSKYRGDFKAGKRHGSGTYVYANGDAYQGQWEEDLKHGQGTYTYQQTGSQKKGLWERGTLTGPGEIIHADHKLTGRFINNDRMDMPVKLTFTKNGFTKEITDPTLVGMGGGDAVSAQG
ncbi:Radial spoke head 1 [Rhizophlyctis rosea]|nr:Radial spoke head 1 [Rhizophlyctis rosea]